MRREIPYSPGRPPAQNIPAVDPIRSATARLETRAKAKELMRARGALAADVGGWSGGRWMA